MKINIHKECEIESTIRTELLSSMFEVPAKTKLSVTLTGDLPLDRDWNIGLIVGPSGSGKTILLESLFGKPLDLQWNHRSVIDDFPTGLSMEDISRVCQSVGFNTIPSWLRPFSVLSNGEKFRVETARRLLDLSNPITIDEFTSVVDRQVAQIASYAVGKFVRSSSRHIVVASCHYDIINWLQPDWILEPGNPCRFAWRSLQQRPPINVSVSRIKYETWNLFREFHYMSADLNRAARCYGLSVEDVGSSVVETEFYDTGMDTRKNRSDDNLGTSSGPRISTGGYVQERECDSSVVFQQDNVCEDNRSNSIKPTELAESVRDRNVEQNSSGYESGATAATSRTRCAISNIIEVVSPGTYRIASMCGVLYRPHPRVSDIYGFTRMVTLPDFQGLGLAFVLACKVASAYKALGKRLHSYPNHPAWIRSYQRSSDWMQVKQSGSFSPRRGISSSVGGFGGRSCAVFQYIGNAMKFEDAERLINVD